MPEQTKRTPRRARSAAAEAAPPRNTQSCLEAMRRLGMIDENFNILPPRATR